MASKKSWTDRTIEFRRAAVMEIQNRPKKESAAKAIARVSAKYNGRALPGGKHLHLSSASLKRIWNRWNSCRSDAALKVLQTGGQRKPIPRWTQILFEFYAMQNGLSLGKLFDRIKAADPSIPWTKSGFYRQFSRETRQRIAHAARLRKRQAALDKETAALGSTNGRKGA